MINGKYVIAVDFDGTLCEYDFPKIGKQTETQLLLLKTLILLRLNGHKIILWTNRGDNDQYKVLTEAIEWCKSQGLEFDAINENIKGQKKLSGPSPKIMADIYIDDKAYRFNSSDESQLNTLNMLLKL